MLAGAGYVLRRVHLVRAFGHWLASAGALMDQAEAHKGNRHNVVVAEIDRPEGFAIAERALRLPKLSLWLASREDPLALAHSISGEQEKRFKALLAKADGWTRCDHLVASSAGAPKPADAQETFAAKAVRLA